MDKNTSNQLKKALIKIVVPLVVLSVLLGGLELWARYKYFHSGYLRGKGFLSRGKEYAPANNPMVRIICVGGSATYGDSSLKDEETYPAYLEKRLNERLGAGTVEVVNGGMAATTTEYQSSFIKERIGDQKFDILVWDTVNSHLFPFFPTDSEVKEVIVEKGRVKNAYDWRKMGLTDIIHVFLSEHSLLYTRIQEKFLRIRGVNLNDYYAKPKPYVKNNREENTHKYGSDEEYEKTIAIFVGRLHKTIQEVVAAAKRHDVETVLLIGPYPYFGNEPTENFEGYRQEQLYYKAFAEGRECLKRIGKEYGVLFIDADSEFLRRGRTRDLFFSGVHLSGRGNKMLADIIASGLEPLLK